MEFTLKDFEPSDGIGECEHIIQSYGGKILLGVIELPKDLDKTAPLLAAIDYLISEWDYAYGGDSHEDR